MPSPKPTIAITGASGFVGGVLVDYFAKQGYNVIGLVRKPKPAKANVSYRAYDLQTELESSLLSGVDYLVHAAYIKYDKAHPDALELNVKAAQQLLAVSRAAKVSRNLFISTMSAHDGATSVYGRQKLAVEALFNTPKDISLRSGLIMGDGGIVREMATFMRSKHAVPLIDGGKQPLQIIAVEDLARVIEAALKSKLSGTLTVAHPQIYLYKTFYKKLAAALHAKVLYVPIPYVALLSLFRLASALHVPLGVGEDNLQGLKALRAADTAPDLQKLGVQVADLDAVLRTLELA